MGGEAEKKSAVRARIAVRRAYDPPGAGEGRRFLVDRLWPRGVTKDALRLEAWAKEAAPSDALRRWFGHDPGRWEEFQQRYFAELDAHPASWRPLWEAARHGPVALIFGARDAGRNNAVALKRYLEVQLGQA